MPCLCMVVQNYFLHDLATILLNQTVHALYRPSFPLCLCMVAENHFLHHRATIFLDSGTLQAIVTSGRKGGGPPWPMPFTTSDDER